MRRGASCSRGDVLTLAVDASTYAGSVAVLRGTTVLAERTTPMRGAHEERLMPAAADALSDAMVAPRDLDRIVCGEGPGSFTSLRIAGAIAKGIAAGAGCPLHTVSSLVLLVAADARTAGAYLAVLGALRGESFVQRVDVGGAGAVVSAGPVERVADDRLGDVAAAAGATIVGSGHASDAAPHARGLARVDATSGLVRPADLVAWEPNYGRAAEAQVRWEARHGRPLSHG